MDAENTELENETPMSSSTVDKNPEIASQAELLFAGHYLNLFGVLLLILGLGSYIRTSGAPFGLLEVLISGGLGLALLAAGANFTRTGLVGFAQPLVAAGLCLDFFAVCSAHFRHHLINQATLFIALLVLVVVAFFTALKLNAKLIGIAMLAVCFLAPAFLTFHFSHFSTIFLYLLAVNLASTAVAFYKKWDFQLLASALGSYALYFLHFRGEQPMRSLLMLILIYALSLVGNNLLYFVKPRASEYNLVLSFVNPTVFALLSAVVLLALPNGIAVTVYFTLAVIHAALARLSDSRRRQTENFLPLATTNLALSLLFLCAAISFITYFSSGTTFFGAVTFLLFGLALGLQHTSFKLHRHSIVLGRFSSLTLLLASTQVWYVLPSMPNSGLLRWISVGLYSLYLIVMITRRSQMAEPRPVVMMALVGNGFSLALNVALDTLSLYPTLILLGLFATLTPALPMRDQQLPWLVAVPHALGGYLCWLAYFSTPVNPATTGILTLAALTLGASTHYWLGHQRRVLASLWLWPALLAAWVVYSLFSSSSLPTSFPALALHLGLLLLAARVRRGDILAGFSVLPLLLILPPFLMGPWMSNLEYLLCLSGTAVAYRLGSRQNAKLANIQAFTLAGLLYMGLLWTHRLDPVLSFLGFATASVLLWTRGAHRLGLFVQTVLTIGLLFSPTNYPPSALLLITLYFCSTTLLGYLHTPNIVSQLYLSLYVACGLLSFQKLTFQLAPGSLSTFIWVVTASLLLLYCRHRGLVNSEWTAVTHNLFDYTRFLFIAGFIKAVFFDANFGASLTASHFTWAALLALTYLTNAHLSVEKPEVRNLFVVAGLLVLCFQFAFVLHGLWGDRLVLQPLLSGFWSSVGFVCVLIGVHACLKVYRIFGLATLVGNTAKIIVVDIHVLDAYSKVNTYLILGVLLILTSLIYQKQKDRLLGIQPTLGKEAVAPI